MSRYKNALQKLDELDAKRREQERMYRELRRSILHHGVESGEFKSRQGWIRDRPPSGRCLECGRVFEGGRFIEFLTDADEVIARYHEGCS